MKTTDLSRIVTSSPVNKTAGMAVSGGINFDDRALIERHGNHFHAEAPPKCVPKSQHPRSQCFIDYTGKTMGRMVIVGLLPPSFSSQSGAKWLARCSCGDFEARTAKALRTNVDPDHACQECNYNRRLREGRPLLAKVAAA